MHYNWQNPLPFYFSARTVHVKHSSPLTRVLNRIMRSPRTFKINAPSLVTLVSPHRELLATVASWCWRCHAENWWVKKLWLSTGGICQRRCLDCLKKPQVKRSSVVWEKNGRWVRLNLVTLSTLLVWIFAFVTFFNSFSFQSTKKISFPVCASGKLQLGSVLAWQSLTDIIAVTSTIN